MGGRVRERREREERSAECNNNMLVWVYTSSSSDGLFFFRWTAVQGRAHPSFLESVLCVWEGGGGGRSDGQVQSASGPSISDTRLRQAEINESA